MSRKKRTMNRKAIPLPITPRPKKIITADDYRLPFTLGGAPESEVKALDDCFMPVANMLNHSLRELGSEGLPVFPGYGVLSGLSQNSLIRAGVELRTNEMIRKWGEFCRRGEQGEDGDEVIERINADIEKFKIKAKLRKAVSTSGYMGGAIGFFDFGDKTEDLVYPLTFDGETIKQDSLKGIRIIEPFLVTPGSYNSVNPMSANYFEPEVWYVQGIPVHSSRLFYVTENELTTLLKPAYNFFGISLSQKVLDAVAHFTSCREAAGRLLKKYSLTTFKTDMSQVLTGGLDDVLRQRIEYFVQNRDNDGVAVVDKETEDIVVMTTSLSGVTDVVRQAMEYVAAMFNEPVTKMWGLSPAGFNTGDNDLQNHYDNIASLQEKMLSEPIKKISAVLQFNAFGKIDKNIIFKFTPLNEEDLHLGIENNKLNAERDTMLIDAGIISPEEARQRLINDLNSGYNSLDPYEDIKSPMDLEEKEDIVL